MEAAMTSVLLTIDVVGVAMIALTVDIAAIVGWCRRRAAGAARGGEGWGPR